MNKLERHGRTLILPELSSRPSNLSLKHFLSLAPRAPPSCFPSTSPGVTSQSLLLAPAPFLSSRCCQTLCSSPLSFFFPSRCLCEEGRGPLASLMALHFIKP